MKKIIDELLEEYELEAINKAIATVEYYTRNADTIEIYRLFNINTEPEPHKNACWCFEANGFKDEGMQYITHKATAETLINNINLRLTIEHNIVYPEEFEVILNDPDKIKIIEVEKEIETNVF